MQLYLACRGLKEILLPNMLPYHKAGTFGRWLELFTETIDALLGPMANQAKKRAGIMPVSFVSQLENYRAARDLSIV